MCVGDSLRLPIHALKGEAMICTECPNEVPADHGRNKTCSKACFLKRKARKQRASYHKAPPLPRPCSFCKQVFVPPEGWGKTKSCPVCHAIDPAKRQAMLYARHIERNGGKRMKVLDDTAGLLRTGNEACRTRREGKDRGTPSGFLAYYQEYPFMYQETFKEPPTPENIQRRAQGLGERTWDGFCNPAVQAGRQ